MIDLIQFMWLGILTVIVGAIAVGILLANVPFTTGNERKTDY